jgi:signal transduction histidine kinase
MVFTAVQQMRVETEKLTENDTVVAAADDFLPLFENILRVLPDTKTITIVSGASPNERFWQGVLKRDLEALTARIEFKWLTELSFEDVLKETSKLPAHTAVFFQLMNVDAAGVVYEGGTALTRLAATANRPVFTYDDAFFGDGILGGPMASVDALSKKAAAVALRILDGEKASDIKTPPTGLASPKFDWRPMQRFGISENDLPPGSTVFFKPPTAWETYRWQIVAVCAVLALQAALIALLLLERQRRHSAEMQSRERMAELAHVNRFATAGEMAASIAHEINQPLGAILNNGETAKIMLESRSPDLQVMKEIVHDIVRDNLRASEIIGRLRSFMKKVPLERKEFDLNDTIAETVKFLSPEARSRDIVLRSRLNGTALRINGDPIQLQQVFSNLILNGLDAASDTTQAEKAVTVATVGNGKFAEISVADTGPGVSQDAAERIFDPFFSTKDHGMGMGLSIVRTIVETHNGQIEIDNRNGTSGAVFRVKLPLA